MDDSSVWSLRLADEAATLAAGRQLARGLGAEGYGVYGLAMSIVAMLTVPTEFGLPQLLTREVASAQVRGDWNRIHGVLRWSIRASLTIATVVAVGVVSWLAVTAQIETPLGATMIAGVCLIPMGAMLSLRSAALRGAQQIVRGQFAEVVVRPALHSLFLFVMMLAFVPLSPGIAMWLGVAAAAGAWLVADRLLHRAMPPNAFDSPPVTNARQWWLDALPMAMTEGMRLLQAHLLIFSLGAMVSMADVGLYRMAASTVALVAMPLSLFNIVSMPVIAKLHAAGERARLQRMISLVACGMTTGVIALSLPFLVAGEWLIGHVFGEEFLPGSGALSLLCISAIINAVFGANAALLNMTGHQARVTRASVAALVVLAIASLPLIHAYGIRGAALANILSVLVWNWMMWLDCRRMLRLDPAAWGQLPTLGKETS